MQIRDRESPHRHDTHAMGVTLLAGSGSLHVGASAQPMTAGDVAFVAAGTPHYFVNDGPRPAVAFVVFAPAHDGTDHVPESN